MKHFIDYANNVSKQTFSAAVIVDSNGVMAGRIIIRFTDSQIGYNHQAGVLFHIAGIDFSDTRKGNTYSQPGTLFHILDNAGVKQFNFGGQRIVGYDDKDEPNSQIYDSMSTFNEITTLKFKRKTYRILWAM